jgi:hypothetical protein
MQVIFQIIEIFINNLKTTTDLFNIRQNTVEKCIDILYSIKPCYFEIDLG